MPCQAMSVNSRCPFVQKRPAVLFFLFPAAATALQQTRNNAVNDTGTFTVVFQKSQLTILEILSFKGLFFCENVLYNSVKKIFMEMSYEIQ